MKNGKFAKRGIASKALVMILVLVLVSGISVGATLAWLVDDTNVVTNTFTVGDINIDLTETTGTTYTIVPGGENDKNPTLTVQAASEKCYVYVSITNDIVLGSKTVATTDMVTGDWVLVGQSGNEKVYRYIGSKSDDSVVDAASANVEIPVFTKVSYDDGIVKGDIDDLNGKTIVIQGYAHQSENTNTTTADAAAVAYFAVAAVTA